MNKKHPECAYDGKYLYFRQDFVVDVCKEAAKDLAEDFESKYIERNITIPSEEGKDVDVRFEKNIAAMNRKNILMTAKFLSDYFSQCAKKPKK